MKIALRRPYGLLTRGEAGLACDKDGLALGAVNLTCIPEDASQLRYCVVRSVDEIAEILCAAYGPQTAEAIERVHRGLSRAAALIDAGDFGRAGIEAVKIGLPDLSPEAAAKLAQIADLEKGGTSWQNQPRVPAGQTGGGEWTSDGAGGETAATVKPASQASAETIRPKKGQPQSASDQVRTKPSGVAPNKPSNLNARDGAVLIPVSMAPAMPLGGYGAPKNIVIPKGAVWSLAGGMLSATAAWLNHWTAQRGQEQVNDAVNRFGLDPRRPADLMAANAYVWSSYYLPTYDPKVPYNGPELDAAAQAVMRFALINPKSFAAFNTDAKAHRRVIEAAKWGLKDYLAEKARPTTVEAELRTYSQRARSAIKDEVKENGMVAHHLIPAETWGFYARTARLAILPGWKQDGDSNLIGLPGDEATRARLDLSLPVHRGSHPLYSLEIGGMIRGALDNLPDPPTPLQARAVFDDVARKARDKIKDGEYHGWIKAAS